MAGVNVITMLHCPPGLTCDLQLLVTAKSPSTVTEFTVIGAPAAASSRMVTDSCELEPTATLPKLRVDGLSEMPGAVPCPLRLTICTPALSVSSTEPVRLPRRVGPKVICSVHCALAFTVVQLLLLTAK